MKLQKFMQKDDSHIIINVEAITSIKVVGDLLAYAELEIQTIGKGYYLVMVPLPPLDHVKKEDREEAILDYILNEGLIG